MDAGDLRAARLRSHRLTAPAPTVVDAATHMFAVQAQEFWGGRWALASRTTGAPTISDVDAQFESGALVRSWPMRGTLHVLASHDLSLVLAVTGARQIRQMGMDEEVVVAAERTARSALRGGNRLSRTEFFDMLQAGGINTEGQRGIYLLRALSLREVVVQGPVVPREGAPAREQYVVLCDDWMGTSAGHALPADPLTEFFVRYIIGHGPATARDFAWYSGLPLGTARAAAAASADRVEIVDDDGTFRAASVPELSESTPDVLALAPFEEYYLSYGDRSVGLAPGVAAVVGPGANGMVRPILVARGEIVGVWKHSLAVGRHADDPIPQLAVPGAATDAEIAAALDRYRAFITG